MKLTNAQPLANQDLKFINLSHPDDLHRKKEVRTEIRRHVMKDIGQQRRRPRLKEISSQAFQTFFLESSDHETSQLPVTNINSVSLSQNLATLAHFPVEADMRALELMHSRKSPKLSVGLEFNSYIKTCIVLVVTAPYQAFRGVWVELALCDPGAFHVTLGNAASFLTTTGGTGSISKQEAFRHFEISTQKLRHRLNNFTESMSEGTIVNILAHVCLTVGIGLLTVSF